MDEQTIFSEAIQKKSPAECEAFLEHACAGNKELRRSVGLLLKAHEKADAFLEEAASVVAPTLDTAPIAEKPGMKIGRYKLVHEIGHGGMGVVYMAVQKEPVKRKVALKIIKPGMDTKEVVSRFEAERQALALMDHQYIATVLDGGSTESGRPYFVMELVEGTPIGEYCDACRYTTRQRLELFVQVCQAVQHAHLKGIIHRDIKPSNILVTTYDCVAVPKVIDFGIAKAVHQPLTDASVYTNISQMVGTPLYMSPEEAQRTAHDVDTRTDVYSLGVLLYELLAGTTPFDKERFQESSLDEVKRIIREEEPPKPSTRLSTLGETGVALDTLSETHHTDLRTLTQELSGELDWIVMKAMEKDRNRRYESASELAKDVQRYLDDEPVEACPPSTAYRFGKFYRRNRVAITATAILLLTLLAGIGGTTWQAVRATQERTRAETAAANEELQRREAERQRDEARQLRERAKRQEQIAQENFERAQAAVDEYLTRVSQEKLLNTPGLQPLRKDLLELALKYYQEFIALRRDDPTLQADLARAYSRVGRITSSIGSPGDALKNYQAALDIRTKLVAENPQVLAYQQSLAACYNNVAIQQSATGESTEAAESFQKAIAISEKLVAETPETPKYLQGLAGQYNNVGLLQMEIGKRAEAATSLQKANEIIEKLVSSHPEVLAYQDMLAQSYNKTGRLQKETGRLGEGTTSTLKATEIWERLAASHPEVLAYQDRLATAYYNFGNSQLTTGNLDEASIFYKKAIEMGEKLVAENPEVLAYQQTLARAYHNVGYSQLTTGNLDEAAKSFKKTIEIEEKLVAKYPTVPAYQISFALSLIVLGRVQKDLDKQDDARASFGQAEDMLMRTPEQDRTSKVWGHLGQALYHAERWEEARHAFEKGIELRRESTPTSARGPRWWHLTIALARLGETDKARSYYDQLAAEMDEQETPRESDQRYRAEAAELLGIEYDPSSKQETGESAAESGGDADPDSSVQVTEPASQSQAEYERDPPERQNQD